MNSARQPVVMVGVSGSSASAGALRWAADEARRRNAGLRVVRSWNIEGRAPYAPAAGGPAPAEQRAAASGELAAALRRAFGPKLPAGISAELVQGVPERILIDRSADAGLLVLGSAAPPAQGGRPVGPVVRACLHRAQCPVVVVGVPAVPGMAAGRHCPPRASRIPTAAAIGSATARSREPAEIGGVTYSDRGQVTFERSS